MKLRKLIIRVFNLVFLAGSLVSIVMFATKPIFQLGVSVPLPTGLIYNAISGDEGTSEEPDKIIYKAGGEETSSIDDIKNKITKPLLDEYLGDVTLDISLELPASLAMNFKDSTVINTVLKDSINTTIDKNLDPIINGFTGLVKAVAQDVAKDVIKDQIREQISNLSPDSDAQEIIDQYGLNDDVDELVNEIFEKMDGDEPVKVDDLTDLVGEKAQEISQKLADAGVEGFEGADSFQTEEIKASMEDMLKGAGLVDENGNVKDIDQALALLLDQIPGSDSNDTKETQTEEKSGDEGEQEIKEESPLKIKREGGTEPAPEEDLNTKVKNLIDGLIADLNIDSLDLSFGGITGYAFLGLFILMIFPWALFALITIFRTIRKRKCWTKPWIVFSFASLQLVFGIGLLIATKYVLPTYIPTIAEAAGAEFAPIIEGATLSIGTSALVPSLIYLAFIPLTIIYIIVAHKVKKDFKQYKRDKKAH